MTDEKQVAISETERGVTKAWTALSRRSFVDVGDLEVVWCERSMVMNSKLLVVF